MPGRDGQQRNALDQLRKSFSGELVTADTDSYDELRSLFNSMIDKRPALIARCSGPDDVAAALAHARREGLEVAVRAGGHSVAGMSATEGGVVIDVRPLKKVEIDPAARTARVGSGVTWGEFDRAAQEHGLATTGGRVSTTGVAGFTLGGGSGWLERKHGLACDNLRSVDLVLANGDKVTASRTENPDLFWALHGGGGNFGVATEFEFDLHPVGPIVLAGLMAWPAAAGDDVAHIYRELAERAPEEFGSGLVFLTGPPEEFIPSHLQGQTLCAVALSYIGDVKDGEALIEPLRKAAPEVDLVQPMPYAEFQCMIDDPPGMRNYWGAEYLDALSDDAIAVFLKASSDMRSPLAQNILFPWGGAVARVTDADTPMSKRNARWIYHPFAVWESPADDDTNIAWARQSTADMRQFASGGIYLNFIGDEGQDRVRAAYGDKNYARLQQIKMQYDPDNVFRLNPNIRPG